jgi:hypothetical protein
MPAAPQTPDADILRQLDELEAESNARREDLKEIAAQLPATISRRALVKAVVDDFRYSPQKKAIAKRGLYKITRWPLNAAKRLQLKIRARRSA